MGAGAVDVIFRVSISSAERNALLDVSTALLYTPANEHFGIVPLECMQVSLRWTFKRLSLYWCSVSCFM